MCLFFAARPLDHLRIQQLAQPLNLRVAVLDYLLQTKDLGSHVRGDGDTQGVWFPLLLGVGILAAAAAAVLLGHHPHLAQILGAVKIPVVIQHLPQAGGMADVADLLTLADEFPNLKIVKCETSPPAESIKRVAQITNGKVQTLIGWGGIFWDSGDAAGAKGIQPGCGVSDLYKWTEAALVSGDRAEFVRRLNTFIPWVASWIDNLEFLIAVEKHILFRRGIIKSDYCRHPTMAISEKAKGEIEECLALIAKVEAGNG